MKKISILFAFLFAVLFQNCSEKKKECAKNITEHSCQEIVEADTTKNGEDDIRKDSIICCEIIGFGDSLLWFENMDFQDIELMSFLIEKKFLGNIVEFPADKYVLADSLNLIKEEQISDCIFNAIVENFSTVNKWPCSAYSTKENLIQSLKNDYKLYYWGQTVIDNSFDSFLFLMEQNNDFIERELFLINVKGETITSISSLFNYSFLLFATTTYTYIDKKKKFHCQFEDLSDDNILPDSLISKSVEYKHEVVFSFDKKGRVVLE